MKTIRKYSKKFIVLLFAFMFLYVNFSTYIIKAEEPSSVNISVDQDNLLDIVLTLGQTDSDVTNLEADLTAALISKGVPADKIKIQAVQSSEVSAGNTSSGWETYDHTNNNGTVIPYYRPYYNEVNGNYVLNNHITPSISGGITNIDFYGYGAPGYKDFMYMPNGEYGKKIFDFTIQEGSFYDALNGAGFIFNVSMTSNTDLANRKMSGYLLFFRYPGSAPPPVIEIYKFTNVDVNTFHNSTNSPIESYSGFTKIAYSSLPGNEKTRVVNIEVTSSSLKMKYNNNQVNWTLVAGGNTTEVTLPTDFNAYGFGPLVGYLSHGCYQLTHFTFNNVTMTKESSKRFSDVIREPEWRDESKRFIINAEDGAVADFSDSTALGEILSRLGNENINYIGWGKNETDGNAFIAKNENNGLFIDKDSSLTDTYTEQIQAMADYIYNKYTDSVVNDTEYLIYGKPSSISITPESEKTNTIDADWPGGKWKICHDESYYENSTGTVPYDSQYLNNLDISFTEAGKYEIYYKDELVKTVYVHRKPVASFTASVDASNNLAVTDNSYDPDYQSQPDKGIKETSWAYKETTSDDWISGLPATLEADKDYIIKEVVKDNYNVYSDPYYRFISTKAKTATSIPPVAEFNITPAKLLTYNTETVNYNESSYDPQGEALTEKLWTITKDGTEVYSASSPKTNFSAVPAGVYKISLKVKNSSGVWSDTASKFLTVVRDTTAPTVTSNTASGTYNDSKTITLSFNDEENGSGFKYRYTVLSNSTDEPDNWGSMGTNNTYSLSINTIGTKYIHYKAYDYAGNETKGYFGPFTIADTIPPADFTIDTTIDSIDKIAIKAITTDSGSGLAPNAYRIYNGTSWSDWKSSVDEVLTGYTRGQEVTLKVEAKDNAGNVRTVEKTVATLQNTEPKLSDDDFTLLEDSGALTLDVLANDTDDDADDVLSIVSLSDLSDLSAGSLTLEGGIITFTPAQDYNGTVTFTYTAKDTENAEKTATATINVLAVNDTPTASNIYKTINEDEPFVISVLSNAEDIDGDDLSVSIVGKAKNGTVTKEGNSIKYTPKANYFGEDSFSYSVTDGEYTATAYVYLTIKSVNDKPVLSADEAETYYGEPVVIDVLANDTDIESFVLKISSVSSPKNGKTKIADNKITYTPNNGFAGDDIFTYTVADGDWKVTSTVKVTVKYPQGYTSTTDIFTPDIPGDTNGGNDPTGGNTNGGNNEIVITQPPSNGQTEISGGSIFYNPSSGTNGQNGLDTYKFKLSGQDTEYLALVKTDENTNKPTTIGYGIPLNGDAFDVDKNSTLKIELSEYIDGGGNLEVSVDPSYGTVAIKDGILIYTPNKNFSGQDGVIIYVTINGEKVPYAAAFNVLNKNAPFFTWHCIIAWIIAAALLYLNYRKNRGFYKKTKARLPLYIVISVILLAAMCWLRTSIGYIVPAIAVALYIAANYIYASIMIKRENA